MSDDVRTFTLPRQALNDAENLMIAVARNTEALHAIGWLHHEQRIQEARRAISDAITESDREHWGVG